MSTTIEDLVSELKRLMAAATKEPLAYLIHDPFAGEVRSCEKFRHICTDADENNATMEAMVAAFNAAPELIETVEKLQARVVRADAAILNLQTVFMAR